MGLMHLASKQPFGFSFLFFLFWKKLCVHFTLNKCVDFTWWQCLELCTEKLDIGLWEKEWISKSKCRSPLVSQYEGTNRHLGFGHQCEKFLRNFGLLNVQYETTWLWIRRFGVLNWCFGLLSFDFLFWDLPGLNVLILAISNVWSMVYVLGIAWKKWNCLLLNELWIVEHSSMILKF